MKERSIVNLLKVLEKLVAIVITILVIMITTTAKALTFLGVIESNPFSIVGVVLWPMMIVMIFGLAYNLYKIEKFKNIKDFFDVIKDKDCRKIMIEDIIGYIKKDSKAGVWYARSSMNKIIVLTMFDGALLWYFIPQIEIPFMIVALTIGAISIVRDTYNRFTVVFS